MTKIFKPLIDWTVEVYIDNIVVKSKTRVEHIQHLEEPFHIMRAYNMKLNPAKYAFNVNARKFLWFMVTQRGIEVNSAQVKVVLETLTPNSKKELQHLIGCLVAWYVPNWCLNWFMSSQWSLTVVPFDLCPASVPWLWSSGSNQQNL